MIVSPNNSKQEIIEDQYSEHNDHEINYHTRDRVTIQNNNTERGPNFNHQTEDASTFRRMTTRQQTFREYKRQSSDKQISFNDFNDDQLFRVKRDNIVCMI